MRIIEYFEAENQEYWLEKIGESDWGAGCFLQQLLKEDKLKSLVGESTKVLLLVDGENLVSYCTFAEKDDIQPTELTPWIGWVYTFPEYRGGRCAGQLLKYAEQLAKESGMEYLHISTNHIGLYEKYGFSFYKVMKDIEGGDSRVYRKAIVRKKRVRLTVAYDGTNYHGWQIQNNGITIESELNKHLSALLGEDIQVIGASRTDSGVHAMGNIAVFDTQNRMPAEKISYAMNQRLPEDIRIQKSEEVSLDWHPRHCSSRKTYEYRIYRSEFPMPVKRLYSYFTYRSLDVSKMQEAAKYLVGEHDFKSFCQTGAQVESTVRTIYTCEVEEQGSEVVIRVCGNGFLYNMVRIIAGTLMDVGQGKRLPESMEKVLAACDRSAAGPTAPAHGLMLIKYDFEQG